MSDNADDKLLKYLESEGYTNLRTLDDGSIVGVMKMLFTWATVVDLEHYGHGGRVCWPTYEQAAHFARTMVTIEDVPPSGYTALKRKSDMRQEPINNRVRKLSFIVLPDNCPKCGDRLIQNNRGIECGAMHCTYHEIGSEKLNG